MKRGGTFTEILMAVGRGGGGGGLKGFTYISINFYGETADEGMIEKILALQTRTLCQNFFFILVFRHRTRNRQCGECNNALSILTQGNPSSSPNS